MPNVECLDTTPFSPNASNLYRYCGNDWANRTDPMGLEPVAVEVDVDRASILAALDNLRVSESNSDRKGIGLERMTIVARVNGIPKPSEERTVGKHNDRGGETIHPPVSLPKGSTASEPDSFTHNHTVPTKSDLKGKTTDKGAFLSKQDRTGLGDGEGKPVYVAVRDKDGQIVLERYRPSDQQALRDAHRGLDSATERLSASDVEKASKLLDNPENSKLQNFLPIWNQLSPR